MRFVHKLQWIALAALLPGTAMSAVPTLNNITEGDYGKLVKELSANFSYSSVNGASSLGKFLGFELGLTGGITKTPDILSLVKSADPNTSLKDKFPHAAALLRVGLPVGLTAEAMIFPKRTISDLSLSQTAGAVQWTITDVFFTDLPVTVATKAYYSKTSLDYKQTINNSSTNNSPVDATIDFDNTQYGIQALVSKKLLVFEPYLGIGYAKAKGALGIRAIGNVTVVPNVFSFPLSAGQEVVSKPNTVQLMAGTDIQLLFVALGAEIQKSYGTTSYTGRLSFRF